MISVPVRDMSGSQVGVYEFDPAELAPRISKQLLHDVVVMYETNRRVGTVKTKSRAEVSASTKKLYRQKGTGRARAGSRKTPVRKGGGHCFALRPRDWSYRMPKKAVRLATRMALLSKFQDDQVVVLDKLALPEPKTKHVAGMLKKLGLAGASCLVTIAEHDPIVWRASRNIEGLRVSPAAGLNAYDLLRQRRLVVTKDALDRLRKPATAET
jgi:large subunit ribosomal protein L4